MKKKLIINYTANHNKLDNIPEGYSYKKRRWLIDQGKRTMIDNQYGANEVNNHRPNQRLVACF